MNFKIWIILVTVYAIIVEAILLAIAEIPLNDGFVVFMLVSQLAVFPTMVFYYERKPPAIKPNMGVES